MGGCENEQQRSQFPKINLKICQKTWKTDDQERFEYKINANTQNNLVYWKEKKSVTLHFCTIP